jgi:hypothetical protein
VKRPHTESTEVTEKKNFSREAAKPAKETWDWTSAFSFLLRPFAPSRLCVRPSSSHSPLPLCPSVPLCESSSELRASVSLRDLSSVNGRPHTEHTEITEKKNFSREAAKTAKKTWDWTSAFLFFSRPFAPSRLCVRPSSSHSPLPLCPSVPLCESSSELRASVPLRDLSSFEKRPHTESTEVTEKAKNFSRRGAEPAEGETKFKTVSEALSSPQSSLPLCFSVALCESSTYPVTVTRVSSALRSATDTLPRVKFTLPRLKTSLPRLKFTLLRLSESLPRPSETLPTLKISLPRPSKTLRSGSDTVPRPSISLRTPKITLPRLIFIQEPQTESTEITENKHFPREAAKTAKKTGNRTSAFLFFSRSFAPSCLCVRPSSPQSSLPQRFSVPLCESSSYLRASVAPCEISFSVRSRRAC